MKKKLTKEQKHQQANKASKNPEIVKGTIDDILNLNAEDTLRLFKSLPICKVSIETCVLSD